LWQIEIEDTHLNSSETFDELSRCN
jgi:hypothetical protein